MPFLIPELGGRLDLLAEVSFLRAEENSWSLEWLFWLPDKIIWWACWALSAASCVLLLPEGGLMLVRPVVLDEPGFCPCRSY